MNNKQKNRLYIKATSYYEMGDIDKSLKKCEEAISEDLKNSAVLNLKGLLLYLKGDLKGAVASWKINSDFNNDQTAKNYIKDVKKDEERLEAYNRSMVLVKKIMIDQAIDELDKCLESDFNSINVNLLLAQCYIKKGEYTTASVYLTKALKIDRNNVFAKSLVKEIKEYGDIKLEVSKEISWVKPAIIIVSMLIVFVGGLFLYRYFSGFESKESQVINNMDKQAEVEDKSNLNEEDKKGETTKEALVNIDEIGKYIESKDYNSLFTSLENIKVESLNGKEKTIYLKAREILENEGIDYFYENGMNFYKNKDFNNAKKELSKAYFYGKDNYLNQHIVFFMAATNENMGNNLEAIKYYEEYYSKYKEGNYFEETIYKLALLYKDEDIDKSINFASELKNNYSNSIYNNDTISNLLEKNK